MKGLILNQAPNSGGALKFTEYLIDYCNSRSIKLTVVSGSAVSFKKLQFDSHCITIPSLLGIKIITHPFKLLLKLFHEVILMSFLIIRFNPDVIFISNIAQGTLLGSIIFKKPILYFFHTYPEFNSNWLLKGYIKYFTKKNCKFITVSKYSAFKVSNYLGLSYNSIGVLYNHPSFLDSKLIDEEKNSSRINILTVGHVTEIKNPHFWLKIAFEIVANFDNIDFYWAGDGDLIETMKIFVNENGFLNRIFFIGHQYNIDEIYKKCHIYLQPSKVESHGIAVIDAMQSKLPVVVSNVGGLPESVDHGVNGFVHDLDDFYGFVNSILLLASNKKLRIDFGIEGKKKCDDMFSKSKWEKNLSEFLSIVIK